MMIRLLLIVLGGWAAWRYRDQIKEYANHQVPRAKKALGEAADRIKAARG
jgi:hypothetical protein